MNSKHLIVQLVVACVLVALGIGLLIAGFCVVPMGIIHSSILTAFGEISAFAGALFGVDYTYKKKIVDKL
ncbi:hypothetical protein [Parabacteroides gordonii]|uniref:Uncharacterized protein n=1 Tax=Parabacteroides gordonii MS-1 = DSM 23371 TaxID=1203610 RepID=A0A0F5JDP9_9BACT|nr:hypothetical protein [Parabacteroides gordonii]KKB55562.1 hypothetical protein HMPREF1536_03033 [Parabacteroides gordonii MS-1 = DSM 23371]MCA5581651.1 hypothetical protein [Parabacteroides gordonii]RGP18098.1 hypothetical protein DXB27_01340 [Parabacteroides gordonii]